MKQVNKDSRNITQCIDWKKLLISHFPAYYLEKESHYNQVCFLFNIFLKQKKEKKEEKIKINRIKSNQINKKTK